MLLIRFFYTQIKPTHNNVQAQSLIVPLVTSPARKPLKIPKTNFKNLQLPFNCQTNILLALSDKLKQPFHHISPKKVCKNHLQSNFQMISI